VGRLPLKLVIIDETIVMFGMEDPVANSEALTIVVVEHPSLAHVLKVAFNAVWEGGIPFDEALAAFTSGQDSAGIQGATASSSHTLAGGVRSLF
jgi:hypothetical protein